MLNLAHRVFAHPRTACELLQEQIIPLSSNIDGDHLIVALFPNPRLAANGIIDVIPNSRYTITTEHHREW